jgi:hypothetical protein
MKRLTSASLLAIAVLALSSIAASAQSRLTSNAQRALQWLQCTQQQPNGQIGNGGNPIARSAEVAFSLAAAGQDASVMKTGTVSLADYLKTAVSTDVGTNGELLLARASQPHAGPTAAVITQLQAAKGSNGEYGADLFSDALAILGLRAAGQMVGDDAVAFLEDKQNPTDHGWSFDTAGQFGSDSNTTALVLQALIASGVNQNDVHVSNGFQFMASQFVGGGFVSQADPTKPASDPSNTPDANSDELGIEAIMGAALQTDQHWAPRLQAAENDLAGRQIASGPDAGALAGFSKLFATTFAPAAFLLRPLTVSGLAEGSVSLLACPATASTSPTPQPAATPTATVATPRLAQTGAAADMRPPLAGLVFLMVGGAILMGSRRRARRP